MKEWRIYFNGKWIGYARSESRADAISKAQAKNPHLPMSARWMAI